MFNLTRGIPKQVVELLKDGVSRTAPEIADELCADASNLSQIMKGLKGLDKVHVHEWVRDGAGHAVRSWKIGAGEDAPRPAEPTSNERKYMARRREKMAAERLEREKAKPVRPFRHWQDVALFGAV